MILASPALTTMVAVIVIVFIMIVIDIIVMVTTHRTAATLSASDNYDSSLRRLGQCINDVLPIIKKTH